MTAEQIFWTSAAVAAFVAVVVAFVEPLFWRRYEQAGEQARQLLERAADTNGHSDPGPAYPMLEAIAELEMRRDASGE